MTAEREAAGRAALASGTADSRLPGLRLVCLTLEHRCLMLLRFERKLQKFKAVTWPLLSGRLRADKWHSSHQRPQDGARMLHWDRIGWWVWREV